MKFNTVNLEFARLPEFRRTAINKLYAKFRDGTVYHVEERKVRRHGTEFIRPIFHRLVPKPKAKKSPNKRGYCPHPVTVY